MAPARQFGEPSRAVNQKPYTKPKAPAKRSRKVRKAPTLQPPKEEQTSISLQLQATPIELPSEVLPASASAPEPTLAPFHSEPTSHVTHPEDPKAENSVADNSDAEIADGEPGMPTRAQWGRIVNAYLNGLHFRKREKALITSEMHTMIYDTLVYPDVARLGSPQFRFWARKMFQLVDVSGTLVITHGGRPVAVKEHIYDILCACHAESKHSGRDKTCKVLREHYTWIPKELTANFVKACPTCAAKRTGESYALTSHFSSDSSFFKEESREDTSLSGNSSGSFTLQGGPNDQAYRPAARNTSIPRDSIANSGAPLFTFRPDPVPGFAASFDLGPTGQSLDGSHRRVHFPTADHSFSSLSGLSSDSPNNDYSSFAHGIDGLRKHVLTASTASFALQLPSIQSSESPSRDVKLEVLPPLLEFLAAEPALATPHIYSQVASTEIPIDPILLAEGSGVHPPFSSDQTIVVKTESASGASGILRRNAPSHIELPKVDWHSMPSGVQFSPLAEKPQLREASPGLASSTPYAFRKAQMLAMAADFLELEPGEVFEGLTPGCEDAIKAETLLSR